jgi:hypothetical protein
MVLAKAKAKARANKRFIVQVSLTIVAYDRQNIFTVQATGLPKMNELDMPDNSRSHHPRNLTPYTAH